MTAIRQPKAFAGEPRSRDNFPWNEIDDTHIIHSGRTNLSRTYSGFAGSILREEIAETGRARR